MMSDSFTNKIERLSAAFTPVMHLFHNLAGEVSRVGEFSLAQYRVLMLVYHEGPLSINDLKARLNIAQSTASELIDRLERQKYLRKEKDPADRRRTLVSVTRRTRKQIERRISSMSQVYSRILNPLTPQEQEELVAAFESILRLLKKSQTVPPHEHKHRVSES